MPELLGEYISMTRRHWLSLVFGLVAGGAWIGDVFWDWKLPGGLLLTSAVVSVFVANFLAFRDMKIERDKFKVTYRPRIRPIRWYVDERETFRQIAGVRVPNTSHRCIHVIFKNDPEGSSERGAAKNVLAEVRWMRNLDPQLELIGRWGDAAQPKPLEPTRDLELASFGIGQERELNLAVLPLLYGSNRLYAFNNENYGHEHWEKPEHLLPESQYTVSIRLRDEDVDGHYTFRVENDHGELTIELLSSNPTPGQQD